MTDEATVATTAATAQRGNRASGIRIGTVLLAAWRRRGDDAGCPEARGSLMRHFLLASPIARLAGRVVPPATTPVLIPSPRGAQRGVPRLPATRLATIAIAAIAVATEKEDAAAVDPRADDQAKRVQAPPRSGGQAGHARGDMR